MQLEDREGATEALLFTTQYERLQGMLEEDKAVLVRAMALPEEGVATKVSIQEIVPLDLVRVPMPSLVAVKVRLGRNGIDRAAELSKLFTEKPGDTHVRLRLESPGDFSVLLDIPAMVRPDRGFRAELERICGADALETLSD